jgi:Lrp/AsnC family leucine-responsive transcriptional regulator
VPYNLLNHKTHERAETVLAEFDPIDRKLIELLQADTRPSLAEMGREVGLSVSSTKDRIGKLVDKGVITGFHAHVHAEAVGLDLLAFLFVGWSDPSTEKPFLERILAEPCVLECHHVTGVWNYALKVRVKNPRMLEGLLANVIKSVPGVERTETIIALSSRKETTQLPTEPPPWMAPKA